MAARKAMRLVIATLLQRKFRGGRRNVYWPVVAQCPRGHHRYYGGALLHIPSAEGSKQRQLTHAPEVKVDNSDQIWGGSTELFRVAFDHAAIGMALVFPNGRWHKVNRSLCEILGYSELELLSRDFQEFVHPDDRAPAMAKLEHLIHGKHPHFHTETRCIHKDGRVVSVLWSVSQVQDENSGVRPAYLSNPKHF